MSRPPVVAVISVRGAEQAVIGSMLTRGNLPEDGFFAGLLSDGDTAVLVPVANAATAPNAMTFETGATPAEHGIIGNAFAELVDKKWEMRSGFQEPPRIRPAWQIADESGLRVVRIGSIFDLRPPETGVQSLSQSAPTDTGFRNRGYPQSFVEDIERSIGPPPGGPDFGSWFSNLMNGDAMFGQIEREVDYMLDATLHVVEQGEVDMLWLDYALFDRVGHVFTLTDSMQSGDDASRAVTAARVRADAYRRADADLGRLADALPPGSVIVLVSGHGFHPVHQSVGTEAIRAGAELPDDAIFAVSRTSAHIYGIDDSVTEGVRERLFELTDSITGDRLIDAVLISEDLQDIGLFEPDRAGDLWIRMADGFVLHESTDTGDHYRSPLFTGDHGGPGEIGWAGVLGCGAESVPDTIRAEDTAVTALNLAGVTVPLKDRSGRNVLTGCR